MVGSECRHDAEVFRKLVWKELCGGHGKDSLLVDLVGDVRPLPSTVVTHAPRLLDAHWLLGNTNGIQQTAPRRVSMSVDPRPDEAL